MAAYVGPAFAAIRSGASHEDEPRCHHATTGKNNSKRPSNREIHAATDATDCLSSIHKGCHSTRGEDSIAEVFLPVTRVSAVLNNATHLHLNCSDNAFCVHSIHLIIKIDILLAKNEFPNSFSTLAIKG
ncbi:MAG: hypothetical protein ACXV8W_07695 [Methylobacter sp.]